MKKQSESLAIHFITVGECEMVQIWDIDGAVRLFEQQSLDVTVSSDNYDSKKGFHCCHYHAFRSRIALCNY